MYMYYCSISAIHRMGLLQGSDRIRKPRPWLLGTRASMAYEGVHIRKANPMDAFFDASVNGKKFMILFRSLMPTSPNSGC